MSPRARGLAFAAGAGACALLAALAAQGHTGAGSAQAELRPVLVTAAGLERGRPLTPPVVREALEVRRVPESYAPADALASPTEALGRSSAVALPPGAYVTASVLATPPARARRPGASAPPPGTTPVDVSVSGAAALAAHGGSDPPRVDVVVAGSAAPGPGSARVRLAARDVRLLALEPLPAEPGLPDRWRATLALTRPQALAAIRAESLGRTIRLLAR